LPRETITIELSKLPPFEAAALLFGILAYPIDRKARALFVDATCNVMLRRFAAVDPNLVDTPAEGVRPRYWMMSPRDADRAWDRGVKVLMEQRLEAARMAAPHWAAAVQRITKIPHPGLEDIGPLQEEMLLEVSSSLDALRGRDVEGYSKANIATRIWKTSKPVLHLCLSLRSVIFEFLPDHDFHVWAFFGSPKLTQLVLMKASVVFNLADEVFGKYGISREGMVEVLIR
jgi:hypothetical protein